MCGVVGYIGPKAATAAGATALIRKMTDTLTHRGPDGHGNYHDAPVVLGHTRLSIIDLATGDQPMANEDASVWVVFNGEIFNYLELRAELQECGHVFRTTSDTEILVHAYEQWGDEFPARLNGQFAIALWDTKRRRLLLVRDRVGIRPLFFARQGDEFVFGSEVKALQAAVARPLRLDLQGLAQVFTFWATVGERTVFEGIHSLPPGHLLAWEQGHLRITQYWDWSGARADEMLSCSFPEAVEQLRDLLQDAVRLQLRADVPVGAYLSGGLDSSGLAALVRRHNDVRLRTFSIAFSEAEFDESAFQTEMANALGTEHTCIRCTPGDVGAQFKNLIWHTETPVLRAAPVPLMLLSKRVHEAGFKVVLTGEGADEVFGGYDIFKEAKIRRFWARQPDSRWRPALFTRLYSYLAHSPVSNAAWTRAFFGQRLTEVQHPFYAHFTRWATTRRLWSFFSDDVRRQLAEWTPEQDLLDRLPVGMKEWDNFGRDQYVEAHTLLSGYLLSSQGDRVAMANSVEGRVPYLDHRIIEFASRLPERYKLRALNEKAILREALRPLLPASIVNRVKQPYRAPDSRSFFVGGKPLDYVEELLSERRIREAGYFNAAMVSRLLDKCSTERAIGFADNMAFVGVLSTMLVDEMFIRRPSIN